MILLGNLSHVITYCFIIQFDDLYKIFRYSFLIDVEAHFKAEVRHNDSKEWKRSQKSKPVNREHLK